MLHVQKQRSYYDSRYIQTSVYNKRRIPQPAFPDLPHTKTVTTTERLPRPQPTEIFIWNTDTAFISLRKADKTQTSKFPRSGDDSSVTSNPQNEVGGWLVICGKIGKKMKGDEVFICNNISCFSFTFRSPKSALYLYNSRKHSLNWNLQTAGLFSAFGCNWISRLKCSNAWLRKRNKRMFKRKSNLCNSR